MVLLERPVVVTVPVYKEALSIQACLRSLAVQTYQDFRVLIVDNAFTGDVGVL